jgi:hypothetical protein
MASAPQHACSIWLNGDELRLGFEGPSGAMHSVAIPRSALHTPDGAAFRGWAILFDILRRREGSSRVPSIGQRSAPVQYDIEAMLRKVRAAGPTSLRDLGLD